ncbi:hypothetical protein ACTG2S_05660 [Aeromonas sp. 82P]|uniref:hypothetical protein n=1 Tax=Aeromonas TaxID=642 RepID=UPI0028DA36C8|nr:hypothetical protein [Aeromonas veronii]HDZ8845902.1 hypothetical protein [Aeromonas veronii]HDZ8848935.1 hypothetical protein [Aeromonas veronii]
MSKHLVLLGALTLSGCALLSPPAPTVTPVHLADPSLRGFYIECSSMKACFQQANQTCPQGYKETDRRQQTLYSTQYLGGSYDDEKKVYKAAKPYRIANTIHSLTIQCPVTTG